MVSGSERLSRSHWSARPSPLSGFLDGRLGQPFPRASSPAPTSCGADHLHAMAGKAAAQVVGRVTFILGDQDGFRGQRVFSHSRSPPPCWPTGG